MVTFCSAVGRLSATTGLVVPSTPAGVMGLSTVFVAAGATTAPASSEALVAGLAPLATCSPAVPCNEAVQPASNAAAMAAAVNVPWRGRESGSAMHHGRHSGQAKAGSASWSLPLGSDGKGL